MTVALAAAHHVVYSARSGTLSMAHVTKRTLAAACIALCSACQGGGDTPTPRSRVADAPAQPAIEVFATHELGSAYADSSINVSTFRQRSITTLKDDTYLVSYYDGGGDVRVERRADDGGLLAAKTVVPRLTDRLLGDGHASISMGLSADDRVHLMYGAHATMPFLLSFDIAALAPGDTAGELRAQQWPRAITYPQFYVIDGDLQLWFRADPEREVHRTTYDPASGTFGTVSEAVLLPGDSTGVYMNQLAVTDGELAMSWMYRLPFEDEIVRNEGLYALRSGDGGKTWRDAHGRTFAGAIPRWTVEPLLELAPDRQPLNQTASAFGPDGRVYITYYARDEAGVHQVFLARSPAGADTVATEVVSANETAFDLSGRGTLVLPLSRPQIVVSTRGVHVLYRHHESFVVASRPIDSPGEWQRQLVAAEPLGAWEPTIDAGAWESDGLIRVFVQAARQAPLDRGEPGDAAIARVYLFSEP